MDAPTLNVNLSWNQLVTETVEMPFFAKLIEDIFLGGFGTLLDHEVEGLGGIAGGVLDAFLPDTYTIQQEREKISKIFIRHL